MVPFPCAGTRNSRVPLSWEWQHENFKRMVLPIGVHGLLIFPTMLTFLFQSHGTTFYDLLQAIDEDLQDTLALHFVAFGLVLITGSFQFLVARHAIHYAKFATGGPSRAGFGDDLKGRAKRMWRVTAWDVIVRLVAFLTIGCTAVYCGGLIRSSTAKESVRENSGVIIFITLYFIMGASHSFACVHSRWRFRWLVPARLLDVLLGHLTDVVSVPLCFVFCAQP